MKIYDRNEIAEMLMHSNMLYKKLMAKEPDYHPEYLCPLCNNTLKMDGSSFK